jgi:hypothetical protein
MVDNSLPYVDEHTLTIPVPRERAWAALRQYVTALGLPALLASILGTEPREGFAVVEEIPSDKITLAGRHRFARYKLVFELEEAEAAATVLRAKSYAAFPGLRGRGYRLLVIGSRGHVLATRRLLRAVARLSLRVPSA